MLHSRNIASLAVLFAASTLADASSSPDGWRNTKSSSGKGGGSSSSNIKSSPSGKGRHGGLGRTKSPGKGKGGGSSSSSCVHFEEKCHRDEECCGITTVCDYIEEWGHSDKRCVFGPTSSTTSQPTDGPTSQPTDGPTTQPTDGPTTQPTDGPTSQPTDGPTSQPTDGPTTQPTDGPTTQPTDGPTSQPTDGPTSQPTDGPTSQPVTPCDDCVAYCNTTGVCAFGTPDQSGEGYVATCKNEATCNAINSTVWDVFEPSPDPTNGNDDMAACIDGQCVIASSDCLYCRLLSEFDVGDNNRFLFDLLEGEELKQQLQVHEESKSKRTSLGICDYPGSKHHGRDGVTHQECLHPSNQQLITNNPPPNSNTIVKEYAPWIAPRGGILLANDPGIWSIENFVTEEEVTHVLELVKKYGEDLQMFGPCKKAERVPTNAHPTENKKCFKISPDNVCEGPYDISNCQHKTREEDTAFISKLVSKFENLWPTDAGGIHPYAKFQLTTGGAAPMVLHTDRRPVSFILYLSDGGASTVFPNADVVITPKKGSAYAWLPMLADGSRNPMADHAIQAHPKDAKDRLILAFEIKGTPESVLSSSK